MYMSNAAAAREVVVSTSGGLGEADTGGVVVNIVPRDGGNTFSGTVFGNYAGSSFASSNYTADLKTAGLPPGVTTGGLPAPNSIKSIYDFNPMVGGPIIKDRLWFFATSRIVGANNFIPLFTNANAGTAATTLRPDHDAGDPDNKVTTGTTRLTAAVGRNKFTTYFDYQQRCAGCLGSGGTTAAASATVSVEANPAQNTLPSYVAQATWQLPLTSKLLLEAGYGMYNQRWGNRPRTDGTFNPALVNVASSAPPAVRPTAAFPAWSYRQPTTYSYNWTGQTQLARVDVVRHRFA